MFPLKYILAFITASYFVLFFLFLKTEEDPQVHRSNLSASTIITNLSTACEHSDDLDGLESKHSYRFTNTTVALKILQQLDVYKPFNDSLFHDLRLPRLFNRTFMGFKSDDKYCDKHRELFVKFPEIVFDDKNVFFARSYRSYLYDHLLRGFANIMHFGIHTGLPKKDQDTPTNDLSIFINSFWTPTAIYLYLHLGKQFSCTSQMSNHIPGSQMLSSKIRSAEASVAYLKKYENRPQCLGFNKLFIDTWILHHKDDCVAFFKNLNSKEYEELRAERRIVYMMKNPGKHRGEGVQPMNLDVEKDIRKTYQNGAKCGHVSDMLIMQNYIHNPLLLNGNKFDFRMYLLVASVNPFIAYYHDGFLRVSLMNYDIQSDDKKVLLTNLALTHGIAHDAHDGKTFEGMDEEAIRHAQRWSFERLQTYLLEKRLISDPNWLNNYLRPEFKKAYIHLIKLAFVKYLENSSIYELYGVDFMLDDNLRLWFIEANDGPSFSDYSKEIEKLVMGMLRDHFEIVYGLLRSRMKRVIEYVNTIIAENGFSLSSKGTLTMKDLEKKQAIFDRISKNYFEKEFEPRKENGFQKIIDKNEEGAAAYQGIIPAGCL